METVQEEDIEENVVKVSLGYALDPQEGIEEDIELLEEENPEDIQTIMLPYAYFEHLLNCLANQKFLPQVGLSTMELANQDIIDVAWNKGMKYLTE